MWKEKLHDNYKEQQFQVLGFPCNQFLSQEPESGKNIQLFCETNFSINFPLFNKIEVNGSNTHPLYKQLKQLAPGLLGSERIKWNFTKFLVAKDGQVIKRFSPSTEPKDISDDIEKLLS